MKYTKILLLVTLAVLAMGCNKDKKKGLDITGTWELVDMKTKAIQIGEETIEVVMTFNADNTFSLEQSILRAMITKTSFSIAVDNPRPVLNGAFFQVKNSKITRCCTSRTIQCSIKKLCPICRNF